MEWSQKQKKEHEKNFETFREKYINRENGSSSIEKIQDNKRRCATLVHRIGSANMYELDKVQKELSKIKGFYNQEIPHFTIDCHRYLIEGNLPENINSLQLEEQRKELITDKELVDYDRILKEIIGNETAYDVELKGVAIGGDGLIAQVWFDYEKLQEFNERLGEKVREEIKEMNFQWGIVKNRVPIRVLNLTRFTGDEDREKVVEYIDGNRNRDLGRFNMKSLDLLASDHYIQKKNTLELGKYNFRD